MPVKNVVSPLNFKIFSLSASRSKLAQNAISEQLAILYILGGTPPDSHALQVDCISHNAICSNSV